MLIVANKLILLSVILVNVVLLSVVAPKYVRSFKLVEETAS
jgi:hypothetical protein